jgi:hypothetical protein
MYILFKYQNFSDSILHSSLSPILSSHFAALFPAFNFSLFLLHSSLTMYPGVSLSTPSTHLKYFSCSLSTSSCSFHPQISVAYISTLSTMLPNIIILLLKSPPHFLSPIPQTHPTTLFAFFTTPLSVRCPWLSR